MGLIFPAEDIIHDVVVTMIADEKHRTKFERLREPEAKAYFMSCLKHRLVDIIRREKRRREYLETLERYEKKLETENSNTEMIVVEELDSGNSLRRHSAVLCKEQSMTSVFMKSGVFRQKHGGICRFCSCKKNVML